MSNAENVFRDYETDGVPSSGKRNPKKREIRQLLKGYETLLTSVGTAANVFETRAALFAVLTRAANTLALVVDDETVAYNGLYMKNGDSGSGSWTRVADLPYSFIRATDAGAGTANAIEATTSIPVSESALIILNVFEANTASPVTVSFNGGTALTIKSNSGGDVAVGGLTSGMLLTGYISGSTFRLANDETIASLLYAARDDAEAAKVISETKAGEASDSADAAAASEAAAAQSAQDAFFNATELPIADNPEAIAGQNDNKGMTPLKASVHSTARLGVNVLDFSPDGTVAGDTAALKAAILAARNNDRTRVLVPYRGASYLLRDTLFTGPRIAIDFEHGAEVIPVSGGTLTDGYLIQLNTDDGADWDQSYPNMPRAGVSGLKITNSDDLEDIRGIKGFGSFYVKECSFDGLATAILRPSGFYSDSVTIEDIYCDSREMEVADTYQVQLLGLGDGVKISGIHFTNPREIDPQLSVLGLLVSTCNGAVISNVINGDMLIRNSHAVVVEGYHGEKTQIIVDDASATIRDSAIWAGTRVPLIARGTYLSEYAARTHVLCENVRQVYVEGARSPLFPDDDIHQYDGPFAEIHERASVQFINSYREYTFQGRLHTKQIYGLSVKGADSEVPTITGFDRYSYAHSTFGLVRGGPSNRVTANHVVDWSSGSLTGFSSGASEVKDFNGSDLQWRIDTGTYYYQVVLFACVARRIGKAPGGSPISKTVATTSQAVQLVLSMSSLPRECVARVYRGASSGNYDKYVDIHNCGGNTFFDNGLRLSGHAWLSRTPGDIDAVQNILRAEFLGARGGGKARVWTDAAITAGSWLDGDEYMRTDATVETVGDIDRILARVVRVADGSTHDPGDWSERYEVVG